MKIFLDTANIDDIRKAYSLGVISGVTTNPSLIAREGRSLKQVIGEIASLVDGPISAEAMKATAPEMVEEAKSLAAIHPNVVVKIPMTDEGLKAVFELNRSGVRTNVTLVFSANQALLAALAGATFVSPFVGRIDDVGYEGMEVVRDCVTIFESYQLPTEIIAASIRHPLHVTQAALCGANIATVPYKVLMQMIKHPLTDKGMEIFAKDWESASNLSQEKE